MCLHYHYSSWLTPTGWLFVLLQTGLRDDVYGGTSQGFNGENLGVLTNVIGFRDLTILSIPGTQMILDFGWSLGLLFGD